MSLPARLTRLGLAAALIAGAAGGYAAVQKPSWLMTFTLSDQSGHMVGNPSAPNKVVEYMSYTCGHCANFEAESAPAFKKAEVASGRSSFEIRNYVLNGIDLTAAVLARCGGKGRFFGNHKHLLATQAIWLGKKGNISAATDAKIEAQDFAGFMTGVYTEIGLSAIMQQRGITLAQGKACLADEAALDAVLQMTENGEKIGVHGTPTFMVNNALDESIHDYASLKAKLKK